MPTTAVELNLRLLETTDIHMNLLDYDCYQDKVVDQFGLARTATLIRLARAELHNSLLFDNGDLIQGNPLGDFVARIRPLAVGQVHPAYQALAALGVDAANIGNHEFNYGLPFLRQALATAPFPLVNANLRDARTGAPAFTPYVILERSLVDEAGAKQTIKIGVIGFVPPQVMLWDKGNLEGQIVAADIVQTARKLVPELRAKGAQVVVAIPHSGLERGEPTALAENAVGALARVPGIDAILFGHSHAEFPSKFFADYPGVDIARGTIAGVPAVMPGRWGDHLGVIDLVLDNASGTWKVTRSQGSIRPVYDRANRKPLIEPDPSFAALMAQAHAGTLAYVRGEVTRTRAPIHSYFAQVADDPSVQLVSQAQIAYAQKALLGTAYEKLRILSAAAPFKAGGRQAWSYYTDIPVGPVAVRNVADLYIYPNTLKAVKISGAAVREWLEMSAGAFHRIDPQGAPEQNLVNDAFPSFNFDVIDGVSYRVDLTQAARYDRNGKIVAANAHRIIDLRYGGKPIDEAASFVVVTNNYRASGGGFFPGLDGSNIVLDSPDENREALVRYLASAPQFDPSADNNWRIQPVPGVKLRFLSGAGAMAHVANTPAVRLVKDNGDGSALFELAP